MPSPTPQGDRSLRIFVNNVDGYLAGAICADLAKLAGTITGTTKGASLDMVPPMIRRPVSRTDSRRLLKTVASYDVVVYDLHDADLEELELVLTALHTSELPQEMIFILVSSVGIWARTQREYEFVPDTRLSPEQEPDEHEAPAAGEEGAGEQAGTAAEDSPPALPRRPVQLKCEDYIRRVPTPKFQEWKSIETLVLALKEKGKIRPYVVCSGIPYGNGEEALVGLFKAAWQGRDSLRVIGSGLNYIPLVHCRDVARLVRTIVEQRPDLDYHLAVDRGDLTQRELIQAVADEFGIAYEIESVSVVEALLAEMADIFTLDLRLEPSPLMGRPKGSTALGDLQEPGRDAAEPEASAFRWWCEGGLAANIDKAAKEFNLWRCLTAVRLCIIGPPGSGVDELGKRLAARYNVPVVSFDDMVEEQRNTDTPLGQQLREKLDEIALAQNNPKSTGPFLLPSSLTSQVVEASLCTKPAHYRGVVLCGYPQTAEECAITFMENAPPPVPEDGASADGSAQGPTPPPKNAKAPEPEIERVPRQSVAPHVLVSLSCADDVCMKRLQALERPFVEKDFLAKTDRWQKENAQEGSTIADWFAGKFGCDVVRVDTSEVSPDENANTIAEAVEGQRQIINFLPPVGGANAGQSEEEPKKQSASSTEDMARAEAEMRKRKKEQEERLEQIKREENARLEKHSEPLRQYMMSLVIPQLTSGLVEVCRKQPEDPVGYLAEYLSVYSEVAKQRGIKPFRTPVA